MAIRLPTWAKSLARFFSQAAPAPNLKMATVTTAAIGVNPNEVIIVLTADDGPHELRFAAAGAAQFARDMSTAATQAMKLGQLPPSELAPGREELVAPRATLEEYGQDTVTGDIVLRLRDEEGVLHIFRVDPNEINEFAQRALLHAADQSDDKASH
jgi:hypothetical protein